MGETTSIAWTHRTFNPWMGCAKVSPGCDHCYMFRDLRRYGRDPETVVRTKQPWKDVRKWEREQCAAWVASPEYRGLVVPPPTFPGTLVFTASWSDVFHADADAWRADFWQVVRECPHLIFQVLTKRHGRIAQNLPPDWGPHGYDNVWLGVTGEDAEWATRRMATLRHIPAAVRFLSYEPAVGSLAGANLYGCDWLIIGGESAPGRVFDVQWAREAIALAREYGAAPFVKQLGSYPHDALARISHKGDPLPRADGFWRHLNDRAGADPSEWPADLRVREMPVPRTARTA